MENREVVQLMEQLKTTQHAVNPSADWVLKNRTALLSHIARTSEDVPTRTLTLAHLWSALSLIMPQRTVYAVVRPAVIFVLCVSVGTAGWLTTVSASLASLPGDAMYPVKLATESTQAALVQAIQGDAATAELHLSFASRRADEVHKIIEAGTVAAPVNQQHVQQAVENLKSEIQSASANLTSAQHAAPESAVAVAKSIDRKVEELQQSAQEADVHISSLATVAAIQQLKQVADQVKLANVAVTTSTPASTTSTAGVDFTLFITTSTFGSATTTPGVSTTTVSTPGIVIRPIIQHVSNQTAVVAPETASPTAKPNDAFPIRPLELAPNVVDAPTPIKLETWSGEDTSSVLSGSE